LDSDGFLKRRVILRFGMKNYICAVTADVHARTEIGEQQMRDSQEANAVIFVDCGDRAVKHLEKDDWLRRGQAVDEGLEDVIPRNADLRGNRYVFFQRADREIHGSMIDMQRQVNEFQNGKIIYRGLAGNTKETWTEIFKKMGSEKRAKRAEGVLSRYGLIEQADVEFFVDGDLYHLDELHGRTPKAGFFYLPWKAPKRSVGRAIEQLCRCDPEKVLAFSHDYCTDTCLPPDIRGRVKPCQNIENAERVLSALSRISSEVVLFYGHIGWSFGELEHTFTYEGKVIRARHPGGKGGKILIERF
jgi:hypothetical protein